MASTII